MTGKVMGIDLGKVRIGIAISDGLRLCANPLAVLRARDAAADIAAVIRLAEENEIEEFVVGLPLNMDDTESAGSAKARSFAAALETASGKPVNLWDERLSTVAAEEVLEAGTVKRRKRKRIVDKVAATVILQEFLDSSK